MKNWCQDNCHLFLGQEDLFLDIFHNIAIHISSVVTHDLTVDIHTLLHIPYHLLWLKYDVHVVLLYFYMFHIFNLIFPQTFCFNHFGFDAWFFLNNDQAMKVMRNVYFWKICNTNNHTWPCILMKTFKIGVTIVNVMLNHW